MSELVDAVLGRRPGEAVPGAIAALRRATDRAGTGAAAHLSRLAADPFCRPLAVGSISERPVEALLDDAGGDDVDAGHLLALLAALGGPEQALAVLLRIGTPDVQRHVLEHVLQDWGPDALPLARAVVDGHTDRAVTRTARKALFRAV